MQPIARFTLCLAILFAGFPGLCLAQENEQFEALVLQPIRIEDSLAVVIGGDPEQRTKGEELLMQWRHLAQGVLLREQH